LLHCLWLGTILKSQHDCLCADRICECDKEIDSQLTLYLLECPTLLLHDKRLNDKYDEESEALREIEHAEGNNLGVKLEPTYCPRQALGGAVLHPKKEDKHISQPVKLVPLVEPDQENVSNHCHHYLENDRHLRRTVVLNIRHQLPTEYSSDAKHDHDKESHIVGHVFDVFVLSHKCFVSDDCSPNNDHENRAEDAGRDGRPADEWHYHLHTSTLHELKGV
jgi:hypothetical protein